MKYLWIGAMAVCGLATLAAADTVVLRDGARVKGEVRVGREHVEVSTATGTLSLPKRRVQSIARDDEKASVRRPRKRAETASREEPEGEPVAEREPESPEAAQAGARPEDGPPAVAEVLEQRIDIEFDGAPVSEVVDFLRQVTGANFVISRRVRRNAEGVHLRLNDVTVRQVLDLLGDSHNLRYETRPGRILYVAQRGTGEGYVLRLYDVRDLLVSSEDADINGDENGDGGGLNSGDFNPQFGAPTGGARIEQDDEDERTTRYERAWYLVELMQGTCGTGTWAPVPRVER